jgi:hypothetical protein
LRGPTFSNFSDFDVELTVNGDGNAQQLLHAFPAHRIFGMPRE